MKISVLTFAVALSCSLAVSAAAQASQSNVLPFQATEKTLPNGLRVIIVPTGFSNIVSLQIPVKVGSRNEVEPGKTGFAHFFEHMMFRGTKAYPPTKYQNVLTEIGARQNAYTTDDYTNYHTTFAKDDLEKMLELEADRFMHLDYSAEGFATESRAVLGEYNKNSANPLYKLFEVLQEKAFTTHPYKHTTMGFLKDIEDMPNQMAYSREFFARYYRPEYTTVILAGDVDPKTALPLVEKYFAKWEKGSFVPKIPSEPAPRGPVYAHVPWQTPTLPYVSVAFRGPAFSSDDVTYAATDLLLDLNFGETSELYKRLVEDEQKVDELFTDNSASEDPGLVVIAARVKDPKDAVYVRDEIMKTVAKTKAKLVSGQRLSDAKSNLRYGFARRLDNTETIASTLARFVRYNRSYGTLNELFTTYTKVSADDVKRAAQRTFTDENLVVISLSKDALPKEMATLPKLDATLASTAPGTAPLLVKKSSLPIVDAKLVFDAGSAYDPAGKEGLAALSAAMITEAGSKTMRIDAIKSALFPLAASVSSQVDKEMATLTFVAHKDQWDSFADIAWPMLVTPGFREDDFLRLRDAQLNALTQDLRENNEEELGKERLQERVFSGSRYAHPVLGTVAGLKAVKLADVKAFVAKYYVQKNVRAGVHGDANDALLGRVRAELGKLPAGEKAAPVKISAKAVRGMKVNILEKETRATAISFGHAIDVRRGHPDFVALYLARTWLGEHRSSMSHLYERIREVRGMNYGDYAYIEAFPRGMYQFFPDANLGRQKQLFEVWIRPVAPENATMALRIALYELDKLTKNGLTQEDFERTQKYLLKNVFVMTARQDQELGYALDSEWYGIPEYTQYMREGLKKLTLADVNAAIKKHLSAKDLEVVIIAKDAKGLKAALASAKPSTIKYDAPKEATLVEEDKVIGAYPLGIKAADVSITKVGEVFSR